MNTTYLSGGQSTHGDCHDPHCGCSGTRVLHPHQVDERVDAIATWHADFGTCQLPASMLDEVAAESIEAIQHALEKLDLVIVETPGGWVVGRDYNDVAETVGA